MIGCPYSDHKFIIGSIEIEKVKTESETFWSRNLSEKNLTLLQDELGLQDYSVIDKVYTANEKWECLRNIILSKMDKIAPLKKVTLKAYNKFPWFDLELFKAKKSRDISYANAVKSNSESEWNIYKEASKSFHQLNRSKLTAYFENKGAKDFKNSKKFWDFYKTSIKIRSDKSYSETPTHIIDNNLDITDPSKICTLFNNFFTSIESLSISKNDECVEFIDNHFKDLKNENKLITPADNFNFKHVDVELVKDLIKKMPHSSPGSSGISIKVLKLLPDCFPAIFTKLFNYCISTNSIPDDWKMALVTPLFKKGESTSLNNYRGISVLSPIAKIFEKILASQITNYFENNNLFTPHQHGFRKNHSCESALHELISDINKARNKKLITMLLFIDFKKAFDTVDSSLLLTKLFHYGFNTSSLLLIANYFSNRQQKTKIGNLTSNSNPILLGVPQGSILGPIFFLIYINDLIFFTKNVFAKLFADDTTLYQFCNNIDDLYKDFSIAIKNLLDWCSKNRLDINWSKTFLMVITNKRIKIPDSYLFGTVKVECVNEFKLLGVTLDNNLNFSSHVANVSRSINFKLFSIKRLFYLSKSVKIQFFKTFIYIIYPDKKKRRFDLIKTYVKCMSNELATHLTCVKNATQFYQFKRD